MKRFCLMLLLLSSCAPKVIVKQVNPSSPIKDSEPFIVFDLNDQIHFTTEQIVEDIHITDGGLSVNCSFEAVRKVAIEKSKQMGANAIKIYKHQYPDMLSTCHRIRAKALKMDSVWKYEKEIVWHQGRLLQIRDFKGSTHNRPFQAGTSTYFKYHTQGTPISGKVTVTVETVFDCYKSYFKLSEDSLSILRHEQIHFDLTELYARKFLKAVQEQVHSFKDLQANHTRIFDQIITEVQLEQDKYDSEVYQDQAKETEWQAKIERELQSYQEFSTRTVVLPY